MRTLASNQELVVRDRDEKPKLKLLAACGAEPQLRGGSLSETRWEKEFGRSTLINELRFGFLSHETRNRIWLMKSLLVGREDSLFSFFKYVVLGWPVTQLCKLEISLCRSRVEDAHSLVINKHHSRLPWLS